MGVSRLRVWLSITAVNVNMRLFPRASPIKIAQRDADSIIVNSALSQEEQDEDDPYADFKVPDDLMW